LKQERRALRLPVTELAWEFEGDDTLRLAFRLPAGSYATAVLRELVRSAVAVD
jgi:tRNA pseudouridine13 synthase